MFILKRQDVEIKNIQHPNKDQQIAILSYQGQTFRLLSVFNAAQEEEARALWRDLTDNKGKACVLLEEPDRFSIWGKVRLDQFEEEAHNAEVPANEVFVQACLLLLQVLYIDIEDLLGAKQANSFEKEMTAVFKTWRFPQADSPKSIQTLLTADPLSMPQVPPWQEHHLQRLLEEAYRLGKQYFGNANFTQRALEALEDMSASNRQLVMRWLQQSPPGKLWV
ncbi:MAG TPA: Npun_F0813 family protein [Trichocoleus sp.]